MFLSDEQARPLFARAAKDNVASLRVLGKCGFTICGHGGICLQARRRGRRILSETESDAIGVDVATVIDQFEEELVADTWGLELDFITVGQKIAVAVGTLVLPTDLYVGREQSMRRY